VKNNKTTKQNPDRHRSTPLIRTTATYKFNRHNGHGEDVTTGAGAGMATDDDAFAGLGSATDWLVKNSAGKSEKGTCKLVLQIDPSELLVTLTLNPSTPKSFFSVLPP
jgi:hypothetical protein